MSTGYPTEGLTFDTVGHVMIDPGTDFAANYAQMEKVAAERRALDEESAKRNPHLRNAIDGHEGNTPEQFAAWWDKMRNDMAQALLNPVKS